MQIGYFLESIIEEKSMETFEENIEIMILPYSHSPSVEANIISWAVTGDEYGALISMRPGEIPMERYSKSPSVMSKNYFKSEGRDEDEWINSNWF